MAQTHAIIDRNQDQNTKRLKGRTHDIHKWKTTLERAIKAQVEEIDSLEGQRIRLKNALRILEMPESIGEKLYQISYRESIGINFIFSDPTATECIDRRTGRPDSELIRDAPEEELVQEIALISEIRNVLKQTLRQIEDQQVNAALFSQ